MNVRNNFIGRKIGYNVVFPYSLVVKFFYIYVGTCPIFCRLARLLYVKYNCFALKK